MKLKKIKTTNPVTGGIIIGIFLILAIALTSCIPTTEPEESSNPKGTAGIVLTLEPVKSSYHTVGSSIPFSFFLRIQNKGYHSIKPEELFFVLTGFDTNIISELSKIEEQIDFTDELLYGKNTFNSEGTNLLYPIEATSVFEDVAIDFDYNVNFLLRYCYNYKTFATTNVCINTNNNIYDSGCIPEKVIFSGGQGAPVEFVSVTPLKESDDSYSFNITLKNSGNGAVFPSSTSLDSCEKLNALSEEYGHLVVKAYFSDTERANCLPTHPNIAEGIVNVRCKFDGVSGQYQRLLNLEAEYVYADSANLPLTFRYFK
jgi:hypothetical protein